MNQAFSLIARHSLARAIPRTLLVLLIGVEFAGADVTASPSVVLADVVSQAASSSPQCGTTNAQASSPGNAASPGAATAGSLLRLVDDVPMPGSASRFDYQSFDPTTG